MKTSTATKFAALLSTSVLLLAACSGGGATDSAESSDSGEAASAGGPQAGGTLYILTQAEQILHLDPQRNYTGADIAFAGGLMHRTLVTFDEAGNIVPDLATDIGRTDDGGQTWEFTLRDGITF